MSHPITADTDQQKWRPWKVQHCDEYLLEDTLNDLAQEHIVRWIFRNDEVAAYQYTIIVERVRRYVAAPGPSTGP